MFTRGKNVLSHIACHTVLAFVMQVVVGCMWGQRAIILGGRFTDGLGVGRTNADVGRLDGTDWVSVNHWSGEIEEDLGGDGEVRDVTK
jgi:hypothetical protein